MAAAPALTQSPRGRLAGGQRAAAGQQAQPGAGPELRGPGRRIPAPSPAAGQQAAGVLHAKCRPSPRGPRAEEGRAGP